MKQNSFYIIVGIIGLIEVLLFWASIQCSNPFIIATGFVIGAVLYFVLRRTITDGYADERQNMIDMKTASATLKAFWVIFFSVNLATVVYVYGAALWVQNVSFTLIRNASEITSNAASHAGNLIHAGINTTVPVFSGNSVALTIHENVSEVYYAVTTVPVEINLLPVPPEMIAISHLGIFGGIQILLLVLMLFIYVAFRMYYSHKFGEWDDDEE